MLLFGGAGAALLRGRADHRHLLRHLLVGAGHGADRDVARRPARGPREAGQGSQAGGGRLRQRAGAPRVGIRLGSAPVIASTERRASRRARPQAERGDPHAQESLVGLYRRGTGCRVRGRRLLAGQARDAGQAAPGGDDAALEVFRSALRHGARPGPVQRRGGRAQCGLPGGPEHDAVVGFRPEHQEYEVSRATGDLLGAGQVQAGAGAVPERACQAGGAQPSPATRRA